MGKRGMEMEFLSWWVIGIVVLIIMVVAILILKDKGINAIEYLKNLLRFGR